MQQYKILGDIVPLTFTDVTERPLFRAVSVVVGHLWTVGHLLLRTVLRVMKVKYITDITEETRRWNLTGDVAEKQNHTGQCRCKCY